MLISESSNALIHLQPAPVVARVATATGLFRQGDAWLAREVAVCSHLATAGVPAARPSDELPPGPQIRDGLALSFWRLIPLAAAPVDPRAAGAALRAVHEGLASFDGELPALLALDDVVRMVPMLRRSEMVGDEDVKLLERSARRARDRVAGFTMSMQALHGDSHLGNVVATADGPLWIDFEDAFLGPVEWDLACLVAPGRIGGRDPRTSEEALAAYADVYDAALLHELVLARGVQLAAWTAALAPSLPRIRRRVEVWMRWLRELEA